MQALTVEISNQQSGWPIEEARLRSAAELVLQHEGPATSDVHIVVLDDAGIHPLNRRFLNHDEPTDVLSFVIEQENDSLEGEVFVSAETAARSAERFGWRYEEELLLYVLHGVLHLLGYDDLEPGPRAEMRAREAHYLRRLGVEPPPGAEQAAAARSGGGAAASRMSAPGSTNSVEGQKNAAPRGGEHPSPRPPAAAEESQ